MGNTEQEKWQELKVVVPRPNYHTGCYNSSQMALNQSEKGLFEILKERKNIPVIDKAIKILMAANQFEELIK